MSDTIAKAEAKPAAAPKLELRGVSLSYPQRRGPPKLILDRINLSLQDGEFLSIVGASGCGKSTMLKLISGLERPSAGAITLDGASVNGISKGVGFMFQRDTLLPWSTVTQNISVGLELGNYPREQRADRIEELIRFLRLEGFEHHYPASLSGGMRQRVSLGRLMAFAPSLYLMDEPFGALDAQTKLQMGRELLRIWSSARRSVVFVTHDIEEAVALSDRVIIMSPRPGRIKAEVKIDIPRPRDVRKVRSTSAFRDLAEHLWHELMDGDEAVETEAASAG